jgi:hypothetical protein
VLKLRILALVGEALILPYFLLSVGKTVAADRFGSGLYDRQRGSHRGDGIGAPTSRSQRERRAASHSVQSTGGNS